MIARHFLDLSILIVWMALIGLALMGWGELVRHWLRLKLTEHTVAPTKASIAVYDVWLGICLCISLTELLNFLFAITWIVSLSVLGIGFCYSLARGKLRTPQQLLFKFWLGRNSLKQSLYSIAVLIAIVIFMSAVMVGPTNYDSGLYHFGSIKWLNEHPITYGLVNLHTRLAYNQSYFALIALLNFSPFYEPAFAGTGAFLFLLTGATCIQVLRPITLSPILLGGLLVLVGSFVLKSASPTPDLAVGLFQVVIFFVLLRILLTPSSQHLLPLLLILCVSALTIKLSMAVFCATALCVASPHFAYLIKANRIVTVRLALICGLILCVHALRGYALSGAPFYPSTFAALWALPYTPSAATIASEARTIYSWARLPGVPPETVLNSWDWLEPWVGSLPTRFKVLVALGATLLALNLISLGLMFKQRKNRLLLYLPLLFSFTFWFFTAPDARFLGLVPELTVVLGAWLFYTSLRNSLSDSFKAQALRPKWLLGICAIFCLGLSALYLFKAITGLSLSRYFYIGDILFGLSQIGINFDFVLTAVSGLLFLGINKQFFLQYVTQGSQTTAALKRYIYIAQHVALGIFSCAAISYISNLTLFNISGFQGWNPVPTEPFDQEKLRSGLTIHVPKSDDLCWNTPLPCAPRQQFKDNLSTFSVITTYPHIFGFRIDH